MELWGLKEGSYLFQLTATGSDQPESMSNVTVTVLSPEQTEGKEAGQGGARSLPRSPKVTGGCAESGKARRTGCQPSALASRF